MKKAYLLFFLTSFLKCSNPSSALSSRSATPTKLPITIERLYDEKKNSDNKEIQLLQKNLHRLDHERNKKIVTGLGIALLTGVALWYL